MKLREPPPKDKRSPVGRRQSLLCRLGFHSWKSGFEAYSELFEETAREGKLWGKTARGCESEVLAALPKQNACRECRRCGLLQEHHLAFDVRGDMFCKRCGSYPNGRRTPGIRF